jgi:AcrR family transcriptional regulator
VPKLWVNTIVAHRREVRRAILDTTAALAAEHGVAAVTMSQIAESTGIGRATLYKYFSDVESILDAWHEDHVERHLERLAEVRDRHDGPEERLLAVLHAYAETLYERARGHGAEHGHAAAARHEHPGSGHAVDHRAHGRHGSEVALLVHRTGHVEGAQRRLTVFLRDVLREAAKAGAVRQDIPPDELATFCLHALAGASALRNRPEVGRLVELTMRGLAATDRSPRGRRS